MQSAVTSGKRVRRGCAVVAALTLGGCALLPSATPDATTTAPTTDRRAAVGEAVLFRGASVMTAAGPTQPNADVLVRGDTIVAVGRDLVLPEGATVVDVSGRWITPGLIDAHSHIGVYPVPFVLANRDGNEITGPFTPEVRAVDSFWPQDPALDTALAGGVTAIHVLPGSANLVGGQGATLRTTRSLAAADMVVPGTLTTMKMACGENPKRIYGANNHAPGTRMGETAMLRQKLAEAVAYEKKEDKPIDYAMQALQQVTRGEVWIQNHCYRADEMLLRIALFEEFDVTPRAFHHAVEAYKIAPELADAGIGAAVWADWWGVKMELLDAVPANAAILDAAGVRVAIHSDSSYDVQHLNQEAAKAMVEGQRLGLDVDRDRAIRWITANPAWIVGADDTLGTLEPGKRADLVVWSGDPFSVYTRAELVFIDGKQVYPRDAASQPASDFELGLRRVP